MNSIRGGTLREARETIAKLEQENADLAKRCKELSASQETQELHSLRQSDLYDNAPVGYLTFDKNGVIKEGNLTAAVLLEVPKDYFSSKLLTRWIHPEDRQIFTEHLYHCNQSRDFKRVCELRLVRSKDKRLVAVQLHTVPATHPNGESKLFHTAIVDVSDRRRADDAEAASELKSAFLANMSHEIRTPLGAMLGFIRLLKDDSLPEAKRKKYIDIIERNSGILSVLVNDILDLSKVESNHLEVENIEFSTADLLSDMEDLFHLKASEKGLKFEISRGNIPSRIISDPTRLRQILMNIIGNAIKFTPSGSVRIACSAEQTSPNYQRITFKVHDTGAPITKSQRARLFKKFSQADQTTTRRHGGTGLGLTLARQLANALGGTVDLDTATGEDKGNIFSIEIQVGYAGPESAKIPVPEDANKESEPAHPLSGLSILVVDDSADNQLLIEHLLTQQGARVSFADDGEKGVSEALKTHHDLVLMDVQMPNMDGHEATRVLRKKGFNIPIIALSAHARKEDRAKSMDAGCDGHLTKPINAALLTATVSQLTRNHSNLLH